MDDFQRLEVRCLLAEARCRVYELEIERTAQAMELRFARSGGGDVEKAQRRLDEIYGQLRAAQSQLREIRARAAALDVVPERVSAG